MGVGTERWVVLGEGGEHFGDELFEVGDDGSSPITVGDPYPVNDGLVRPAAMEKVDVVQRELTGRQLDRHCIAPRVDVVGHDRSSEGTTV